MGALSWIAENYQVVLVTITSIIGGASIIVKALSPFLTGTDKDEKAVSWLEKVNGWLGKVALNTPAEVVVEEK